jgi:sulfite oxidase
MSGFKQQDFLRMQAERASKTGRLTEPQRRSLLTPTEIFYVRNHGNIPLIIEQKFQLSVSGLVKKTLSLSLEDITEDFPKVNLVATLLSGVSERKVTNQAQRSEEQWQRAAASTAKWGGIRLRHLLLAVGVDAKAKFVTFIGSDDVPMEGELANFSASIPIQKAMSPEVILAYEMNDKPLAPMHGYPLRAVVPGFAGSANIKWIKEIRVETKAIQSSQAIGRSTNSMANFIAKADEWDKKSLDAESANALICYPRDGETVLDEVIDLEGFAIPTGGKVIERVELSADGGKSWWQARLSQNENPWAWCLWEAQIKLHPGTHQIIVRAIDSARPEAEPAIEKVSNSKRLLSDSYSRIKIRIVEED